MVETPLIRHGFAVPPSPPVGGRLSVYSNRVELLPLWDVWIHILGIRAECACWGAGGPVCRPHGEDVASPGGASGRPRPTKGATGASPALRRCTPLTSLGFCLSSALFWRAGEDTRPYGGVFWGETAGAQCAPLQERGREPGPLSAPVCALGHLSLSPLPLRDIIPTPFGLRPFPPDRGNRPLDKGSRPQGEGLGKTKRDRFWTCPLKHRGEAELRTKFLCFLSFSKKGGDPAPPRRVRFLI